ARGAAVAAGGGEGGARGARTFIRWVIGGFEPKAATVPQPAEAEWTGGDGQRMPRPVGVAGPRVVAGRGHHRLTRRQQLRNRSEFVAARLERGDDAGERAIGVPAAAVGVE